MNAVTQDSFNNNSADFDFALGVDGFNFSDLYNPFRLRDLNDEFQRFLKDENETLFDAYKKYFDTKGLGIERRAESQILTDTAPYLSEFVAKLFRIESNRSNLQNQILKNDPIWKLKFFVQRRAARFFKKDAIEAQELKRVEKAIKDLRNTAFTDAMVHDEELGLASIVARIVDLEDALTKKEDLSSEQSKVMAEIEKAYSTLEDKEFGKLFTEYVAEIDAIGDLVQVKAVLRMFEMSCANKFHNRTNPKWFSMRTPHPLNYQNLVEITRDDPVIPEALRGTDENMRRRDGFKLTDSRGSMRDALSEIDYCLICHERGKDSCSTGLHDREGNVRKNPLNIETAGCPLDEKISEMHLLKQQGDSIGSLALVTVDNPMCAGTGHRICNDCMKGCIFQKQEPVNIPLAETASLTDVLELPYGFEIYSLLTRWNPLNIKRPYPEPYNGKNVMVVGLGPAGYTLAHYLLNEGFGVVGMDGLKIEPMSDEFTGFSGTKCPRPVKDINEIKDQLDQRVLSGFGGVSEYGITVRWDKNFLTMLQLMLTRRKRFRAYGGVRFGGTFTIEDAWGFGFDHIAIATGAGRPTIVNMKNNLIRGIRQASDFLMALQLTGAFKKDTLSNLQVRLPAVVIGGGLTGVDTATELFAYYPVQVEKTLDKFESIAEKIGEEEVWKAFDEEEKKVLGEFLVHGKAVREERERAAKAGELPDFVSLIRSWGGVSLVYRKRLQDSPAYRLNHEEVQKALEEGINIIELMTPTEAIPDETNAVKALVFERLKHDQESGKFESTGETVRMPARTVCVAAGTAPNVIYEKEFPGTFQLDKWKQFFEPHEVVSGEDGKMKTKQAQGGFFTSYNEDGKFISYYGDNHPSYAGNVVKAMASAKDGYSKVVEIFEKEIEEQGKLDQETKDKVFDSLIETLDEQLRAYVVKVDRLTPTIVDVIVKAPLQARKFEPGQFYRLQNFESRAPYVNGKKLMMEGLALTGAWTDKEKGLLSMIVLEMGTSSRLCQFLKEGEEVIVMGPTGTPTEIPKDETVLLAGGGLGNAVLFSIANALRKNDNEVIYFAGYKNGADLFKREEIEKNTDQIVWATDWGNEIEPHRPQDSHYRGNIVEAMIAYAGGHLGEKTVELNDVDRIIAIGSDRMMNGVKEARYSTLKPHLKDSHVAIGSINSPMQCMMKEVCAQCLQKHVNPHNGEEVFVFSCFNQDQNLDFVDFKNLNDRLRANSVQEKLSNMWLDTALNGNGSN